MLVKRETILLFLLVVLFGCGKPEGSKDNGIKPFGFYEGMPIQDLNIVEDAGDGNYVVTSSAPDEAYDNYGVIATKKLGVCKVDTGKTLEINIDEDTIQSANTMFSLHNKYSDKLTSTFGEPTTREFKYGDVPIDISKDWIKNLTKDDFVNLETTWEYMDCKIKLITMYSEYLGFWFIGEVYEFPNYKKLSR